jgi:cbb3-type cytochrome oxidase subunit 3
MTPEEKAFNEQESLALIQEMINKAKNSFVENGIGPLVWGSLVTFCSLFRFCEIQFGFSVGFDIFYLLFIAFAVQMYYAFRPKRKQVKSYDATAISAVWTTFAVCMLMTVHYNIASRSGHVEVFLMLYGVPTYVTGRIKKFKPMIIGGIICWICSILSNYTPGKIDLLLLSISAAAAWLVPGIILRRKYLKLKHV